MRPPASTRSESVLPRSILIVRLGAIGDVTNALLVAGALRRARPDVRIGWAAHDLVLPLLETHPHVDDVHWWQRGSGARGFRAVVSELRAHEYELALDLQRIAKSAALARLSGAPRVVGFDRARTKEASWLWTRERVAAADPGKHMVEHYLDVVRHLGLADATVERVLPSDPAAEAWAEAHVSGRGAPLVVCLGASKAANRWAPERFVELVRGMRAEAGLPVTLVGGPADRKLFAATLAGLEDPADPGVEDLVGRTNLLQLVALLRRARAFVGCDTGPMHLAAAVETPVVALFGPADPRRTGPWGDGHRVLRSPDATMAGLSLEAVLESALALAVTRAPE